MKVAELIAWLQTQPQDAEVLLRDPDTEWLLPLKTGDHTDADRRDTPTGSVVVHADYSDYWS